MRVMASWSGGKDCCLALARAMKDGHEVVSLVNMVAKEHGRCCFHGIAGDLMRRQAECLGLPITQHAMSDDMNDYEREFKAALTGVRDTTGAEGMVFGDIYLDEHREWVERVCADVGVKALEPLWHGDPAALVDEFVDSGFRALVISAKHDLFDESFVGSFLDRKMKEDLVRRGICPAGENGEFHTLVCDGPIFGKRIEVTKCEKMVKEGFWRHWYLDILAYEVAGKN